METPDPSFYVKVDVTNPGHFFACCGLLELAHQFWAGAEGWFQDALFCVAPLRSPSGTILDALKTLIQCEVHSDSNGESENTDHKTSPILLGPPISLKLDWWLSADGKPNLFKTWAANATSRQMFEKWRSPLAAAMADIEKHPEEAFDITASVQGPYGFDSSLGWDSLKVGFSLNEHAQYKKLPTHPAVEILGALGLQRFFPRLDRQKQTVQYATWSLPLSPSVARLTATVGARAAVARVLLTRFVYRGSFKGLDRASSV